MKLIVEQTYAARISPLGSQEPMAYSCHDDNYDGAPDSHCIVGYGCTEIAAVQDYLDRLADKLEQEEELKLVGKRADPQTGFIDELP